MLKLSSHDVSKWICSESRYDRSSMNYEENQAPHEMHEARETQSDRKTWVAPTVSDSPVNDLTSAAGAGVTPDGITYS